MKLTQDEIIIAHLKEHDTWTPTHFLMCRETDYGYIGSAGHVRARELAREGILERKRGADIGLDKRYTYFRYRAPQQMALPAIAN